MIETNIRIIESGTNLYLWTRCAKITTYDPSPKMIEKVCNEFASRGLAAVYCPKLRQILVFTRRTISPLEINEDNWIIQVEDGGSDQKIQFSRSEDDASLLAQLIERHILIQIKRRLKMPTVDSVRIFQEIRPFKTIAGIDTHRRYGVSAIPIQDIGIGISVEISTAFFTHRTVADVYQDDIPDHEQQRLQENFGSLSLRRRGQKGTLLYDLGNNQVKCYFEEFRSDLTCVASGKLIVKGKVYDSLLDYYQQKQPQLDIAADDCVAMVSFKNIDRPQPVAAKLLRLRVMNESLPRSLKQVDKLAPRERVRLIDRFWIRAGNDLLGPWKPKVSRWYWQPHSEKVINLLPPALQFSGGFTLPVPSERDYTKFQEHYRQRLPLLHKVGCLDVPISMERTVYFAIPAKVSQKGRSSLITNVVERLSCLTGKPIVPELVPYNTLDEIFMKLNQHNRTGIVVFVFDGQDPETYYNVAYQLPNWRVKRITLRELVNQFSQLKSTVNRDSSQLSKAERNWNSFIEMIALDVLQQMDCVPWGFRDEPSYDAHLAIDVGGNGRDFALSLLTFRPSLCIETDVKRKIDLKHETINKVILHEEIVKLFKKAAKLRNFQVLRSLLILRDGRECGRELEGINKAKKELIKEKLLTESVEVDVVDFHKSIKKGIRLWEKIEENRVEQVLEGTGFFLDSCTVILTTTGVPTRYQGTAAPVMLVGQSADVNMERVTRAVYASTHLNFSNPNVAQKLPIELKRTDDELKSRDAQEIRRIQ